MQYQNLKIQSYFHLADKIKEGIIFIREVDSFVRQSITEELEQVRRHKVDSEGKLSVLPEEMVKEYIGRSPDYADAIMIRMYFDLKPKDEIFFF